MTTTTVRGSFAARAGRPKMHYAYKKSKTTEKSLPALQDIEARLNALAIAGSVTCAEVRRIKRMLRTPHQTRIAVPGVGLNWNTGEYFD